MKLNLEKHPPYLVDLKETETDRDNAIKYFRKIGISSENNNLWLVDQTKNDPTLQDLHDLSLEILKKMLEEKEAGNTCSLIAYYAGHGESSSLSKSNM